MNQNEELAVAQMRRAVHKLGSSTEGYGDTTLKRFLVARSFNIDKAAKMFVQWRNWRASFVPLNHIPESQIGDELQQNKIFLQGLSPAGNPVVAVKVHRHVPGKDQLQFKKFVVHLLDKTIASGFREKEIGNEKLVAVLDLQKLAYKNIDIRGMITGFQFLQDYYPERLSKCFLLNMPGFFVRVWRLISRFLEKATLEKIVIVSNEEERRALIREVGADVLPEEYGGQAKFILIQDFQLNNKPLEEKTLLT
ncbi:sec14 cytosolic factor-like [Salvia miltiorrhiza]|uniref:sec14 cytosolic factor-like n=1 Tax=Salvia miltiorrhiza TaxID=226208 RepID=UPI0025AC35AC|nr:sec14 cytosolic factor-like [Salvia miltiorrhiza]